MKSVSGYLIRAGGKEFPSGYKVKNIQIYNEINKIPRARIVLLDGQVAGQDFALSNQDFFKPGNAIEIDLGTGGKLTNVFKGIVVRHSVRISGSGQSVLDIECKHQAVRLAVSRSTRFFYDQTEKAVLQALLHGAGFETTISGLNDIEHLQLVQYDSFPWDFIVSRAEANGAFLVFGPENLSITPPVLEAADAVHCQYGANIIAFDALLNGETQFDEVEAFSWNAVEQQVEKAAERSAFENEAGNLSGRQIWQDMETGAFTLSGSDQLSEKELQTWARSRATRKALSSVQGTVSITGNAAVNVGKTIRLSGVGERFNGRAYVTGVRHELGEGLWTTHIQFGISDKIYAAREDFRPLPANGLLPAVAGMHIGIVTALQGDPEGEFRIRVKLAVSSDRDGIWARVSNAFAGDRSGTQFFPAIGDEVVVGFLNDDPRKAIVLGSLYSSGRPAALPVKDENHEKGFITRSDMRLVWDDQKRSVTLSTPEGNRIQINEEANTLLIEDKNGNRIKMDDSGLSLESGRDLIIKAKGNIEISGVDVGIVAQGKFAAQSVTGAEVKTNAIAVLKGSLIQIN